MWTRAENGEITKPAEVEYSGNHVILRKNFLLVPDAEERPMHWEWDEWQMTAGEYEVYLALAPKKEGAATPNEREYEATRNYMTGELITVDGMLYKVVRNIAAGQKITPYLNVLKTNLAEITTAAK